MTRKIKALQILPEINSGEIERSTVELAKFLVQSGCDSYILSNGGKLQKTLEKDGSRHINMPVHKKSLFSFKTVMTVMTVMKLRSFFLKEQFDIIHIRSHIPAWFAYKAWKLLPSRKRPKLVTTFNDYYSLDVYSEIMTKSDALICPSKSIRNFVSENYPFIKKKRLNLIYRGIDTTSIPYDFQPNPKWLQQWRDESLSFKDKFIITLPGCITSWKGHSIFYIYCII